MATASERIPILVTTAEKARIAKRAKRAGLSVGEFLRRAAASFDAAAEDDVVLEGMIQQMLKTTRRASQAIDDALAHVEASNIRIDAMETQAGKRVSG